MQRLTTLFVFSMAISLCLTTQSFAMAQKPLTTVKDAQDDEAAPFVEVKNFDTKSAPVLENQPTVFQAYDHLDPQGLVPTTMLKNAVTYFDANKSRIKNQSYMTLIDMSQNSSHKRLYLVNMKTGAVQTFLVAHGSGSDTDNDGVATKFSNLDGSRMTSLGFYLTGSRYEGKNGLSMHLNGQDKTNSNAYSRAIVMHGADYVNSSHTGRSWGCPAVEPRYISSFVDRLENGSLMYIWKK